MKNSFSSFILFFIIIFFSAPVFSQTLFTYGNNVVSKDEFLRAYNKNKTTTTDKEKAMREYLDLYIKFKLKVKAAKELHLDTLPQIVSDIQNFRSQIEESYLNDDKAISRLVSEAFQRKQKDIHVLHFFIPATEIKSADDSVKAAKTVQEVYEQLNNGNDDYESIATSISKKLMAVHQKDIGFITALSVPYSFENIIYSLNPGAASEPVFTQSGWHVFKNLEERKSAGKWKVAQILFAFPPDASEETKIAVKHLADSVYGLLVAGKNFGELAKKFSEDKMTYEHGGEMPEFITGKFDYSFEKNVFVLAKDSTITQPFETRYGYHIVKRLKVTPTPAYEKADENYTYLLKQEVLKDARVNEPKQKFINEVLTKIEYKRNKLVQEEELFRYADSVKLLSNVKMYPISRQTIFTFGKQNIHGDEWLNFVYNNRQNISQNAQKITDNKALFEKFIHTSALAYYRKHLETYNEDFKYQMQEFSEGNILFEIMQRKVWSKSSTDSAALVNYYSKNKANYIWLSSADILLFNCSNMTTAKKAGEVLKNGENWHNIVEKSEGRIQADSGRYETTQIMLAPGTSISENTVSEPLLNKSDNTATFVKLLKLYPAGQQRSFEEARGLLINDYQNYLEANWVNELKKKYPVKINEAVFQALMK